MSTAASPEHHRHSPRRERRDVAYLYQHAEKPAVPVPLPLTEDPSRSGTTAAPSTARCGTTGRTPVPYAWTVKANGRCRACRVATIKDDW